MKLHDYVGKFAGFIKFILIMVIVMTVFTIGSIMYFSNAYNITIDSIVNFILIYLWITFAAMLAVLIRGIIFLRYKQIIFPTHIKQIIQLDSINNAFGVTESLEEKTSFEISSNGAYSSMKLANSNPKDTERVVLNRVDDDWYAEWVADDAEDGYVALKRSWDSSVYKFKKNKIYKLYVNDTLYVAGHRLLVSGRQKNSDIDVQTPAMP